MIQPQDHHLENHWEYEMRAKEFLQEYMNYSPTFPEADEPMVPIDDAVSRVNYLMQCGEARDLNHALKIVAGEVSCELDMDTDTVESRIKAII